MYVLLGSSTAGKVVYWTASVAGNGYRIVNEASLADSEIVVVMKVVAVAPYVVKAGEAEVAMIYIFLLDLPSS